MGRSSTFERGGQTNPHRLAALLQERIRLGGYSPGDRFLSVRGVAECYGVSPVTAHQGLTVLVEKRWLEPRPRSGMLIGEAAVDAAGDAAGQTILMLVGSRPATGNPLMDDAVSNGLLHRWPRASVKFSALPEGEFLKHVHDLIGAHRGATDHWRCARQMPARCRRVAATIGIARGCGRPL